MKLARFQVRLATAAAITALVIAPTAAFADHGNDTASGRGSTFVGSNEFSFSARSTAFGTGSHGRMRVAFTTSDPDQVYVADVTCLRVFLGVDPGAATTAVIGGRITSAPPGNTIQGLLFFVSDSGKFSQFPDTWTVSFVTPAPVQDTCPTPTFFGSPLQDGEITLHNTLP
jgi:hypothetical protein